MEKVRGEVALEDISDNVIPDHEKKSLSNDFPSRSTISKDTNVMNLQLSIRALVNERREIQSRLSGNKGRGSRAMYTAINSRVRKREEIRPTEEKLPDDQSQKTNNFYTDFGPSKTNSLTSTALEVSPDAFPVEKRPKLELDDSSLKRNRNLFGSLLCHLKKAKTRLDSEKTTRTAELQQIAEQQVSQKLALERKNLAELKRRDFQDRQRRDIARMKELQKELHTKEMQILSLNLQNHFSPMKNFIRTDTLPMIFWIPAVHNKTTDRLLKETSQQIENKIESLKVKFVDAVSLPDAQIDTTWESSPNDHSMPLITDKHDSNILTTGTAGTNTLLTVHPDLINDSDDDSEDKDEEAQQAEKSTQDENEQEQQPLNCNSPEQQKPYPDMSFDTEASSTTKSLDRFVESSSTLKETSDVPMDFKKSSETLKTQTDISPDVTRNTPEFQLPHPPVASDPDKQQA